MAGLSGCNEISNDASKFLIKAEMTVDHMYPTTTSNIDYKGYKAISYRLEIADYTLPSKCEEIRDDLDFALDRIDFVYGQIQYTYVYADMFSNTIDLINIRLLSASGDIDGLQ